MTATELSPDELIRSRAFFDATEFAEIVEDEAIPCGAGDATAAYWTGMRCCDTDWFSCTQHHEMFLANVDRLKGRLCACGICGSIGIVSLDLYRIEKL